MYDSVDTTKSVNYCPDIEKLDMQESFYYQSEIAYELGGTDENGQK